MKFTQIGWTTLAILVLTVGAVEAFNLLTTSTTPLGMWVVVALAVVTALLFGWLKVTVEPDAVRLAFGVGLVRRTWPLASIAAARTVRNPIWTGFGIRTGPNYTLYNVSGRDAVELKFRDGNSSVRIGTDQPAALAKAITMYANHARTTGPLPLLR